MKRVLLTTMLLALGSVVAVAQDVPKADLFFGYSFLRYNSAQTIPAFTANGGLGTFGFNFNNHIALEAELGGYHNGNVNGKQFDTTMFSYLFGPRISYGRSKTFGPYFHILWGGQNATTSIAQSSVLVVNPLATSKLSNGRYKTSTNTWAMAVGGGIDIRMSRHVVLRPIQLDYYLTRFEVPDVTVPPGSTPSSARNQNNLRYAAGLAFNFGGEKPTPVPATQTAPAMKPCPGGQSVPADEQCPKKDFGLGIRVDKSDVCAGETVAVTPAAAAPDGARFDWTVNGESISQAQSFEFRAPAREGVYRIGLRLIAEGYNDASAETTVNVRGYAPPSGSVQASPAEIWAGEKSTISANFTPGRCGGTLRPANLTASEGSLSGNEYDSSTVQFDPSNTSEQQKTITIAANVADDKGSGSAQASIIVKKKATRVANRLPDIVFPVGSARVNNCGKRVLLETLKTYTDSDPTGKVVLVGHQTEQEAQFAGLDQKRALNAAAVISAGQGICSNFPAAQIEVSAAGPSANGVDFQPHFCGASVVESRPGQVVKESDDTAKYRRVEVWFIPTGGTPPASLRDSSTAATLSVSSLGCPR